MAGMLRSDEPERRHRLTSVLWCAGLVAATLVVWRLHVVGSAHLPPAVAAGDLFAYFLPAFQYEAHALREGRVPLWNPYQGAGVPFLATLQPGALYPARLLLLLGPTASVMGWSALGHLLLLVLGTFALCRRLGCTAVAAGVGATAFAGAFGLPAIYNVAMLEPGAWLPVGALALVHVFRGGRITWTFALGACAAMPVLAGGYQSAVYVAYGLAVVALALVLEPPGPTGTPRTIGVARVLLAGGLAVAAAAPQLLPTLAWSSEATRRAAVLTDAQIQPFSSPELRWLLVRLALVRTMPMQLGFLSVPVTLAALAGMLGAGRLGLTLGAGAVAAFLLMLAPGTPWFVLYKALPAFTTFRIPTRLFFLVAFFASVTAALGVDVITHHVSRFGRTTGRVTALGLLVWIAATIVWPHRNEEHLPWTAPPSMATPGGQLWPSLTPLIGSGRAWLPGDRGGLGAGRFVREGMVRQLRVLQDYDPLTARRLGRFLAAVAGVSPPDDDAVLPFTGALLGAPAIARPELLDLVAVRAVVAGDIATPAGWEVAETAGNLRVYANRNALPRAFTVERARFVDSEDAALRALLAPGFDGHREAILIGSPDAADELRPDDARPATPSTIVRDDREQLGIDVSVARPSVLVVADAWAPGWSATVDGVPRRLWQANHLVRAVLVGPGDRRVELRYAAPGFVPGVAMATGAWSLAMIVLAVGRVRRHRRDTRLDGASRALTPVG